MQGKNHNIKIATMSYENVAKFEYLGMTVTNQHFLMSKIKNELNIRNAYFYSVQNL
jgi:hypothetical protein